MNPLKQKKSVVTTLVSDITKCASSQTLDLDALNQCVERTKGLLVDEKEKRKHKFFDKGSLPFLGLLKWFDPSEQRTHPILDVVAKLTDTEDTTFRKEVMSTFAAIEKDAAWQNIFVGVLTKIRDAEAKGTKVEGLKLCLDKWFRVAGNIASVPHILSVIVTEMPEIYATAEGNRTPDINKGLIQILGNAYDWEDCLCLTEENIQIAVTTTKMKASDKTLKLHILRLFIALAGAPNASKKALDEVLGMACTTLLPAKDDNPDVQKAFVCALEKFTARMGAINPKYTSTILNSVFFIMEANEKDADIQKKCCCIIGNLESCDCSVTQQISSSGKLVLVTSPLVHPKSDPDLRLASLLVVSKLRLRKLKIAFAPEFHEYVNAIRKIIEDNYDFGDKKVKAKHREKSPDEVESDKRRLALCIKALSKFLAFKELREAITSIQNDVLTYIFMSTDSLEVFAACLSVFAHNYIESTCVHVMNRIQFFMDSKNSLVHRKALRFFISLATHERAHHLARFFNGADAFKDVIESANKNKSGSSDCRLLFLAMRLLYLLWQVKNKEVMENYFDTILNILEKELLSFSMDNEYDHMNKLKNECFSFMNNITASLVEGTIKPEHVLRMTDTLLRVLDKYCENEYVLMLKMDDRKKLLDKSIFSILLLLPLAYDAFETGLKKRFHRTILKVAIRYFDVDCICFKYRKIVSKLGTVPCEPSESGPLAVISELNEKVMKKDEVCHPLKRVCAEAAALANAVERVIEGMVVENILTALVFYEEVDESLVKSCLEALFSLSAQKDERLCRHILELYGLNFVVFWLRNFDNKYLQEMFCDAVMSLLSFEELCTEERLDIVKFMLTKASYVLPESSIKRDVQEFIRKNVNIA